VCIPWDTEPQDIDRQRVAGSFRLKPNRSPGEGMREAEL
jgi:hypothetical protein